MGFCTLCVANQHHCFGSRSTATATRSAPGETPRVTFSSLLPPRGHRSKSCARMVLSIILGVCAAVPDESTGLRCLRLDVTFNFTHDLQPDMSYSFSNSTQEGVVEMNVMDMQTTDLITLIVCACIIALEVAKEVRDIQLCMITRRQIMERNDKIYANSVPCAAYSFRTGIWVLNTVRQFALVPALTMAVPLLVFYKRGDALSVWCVGFGARPLLCLVFTCCWLLLAARCSLDAGLVPIGACWLTLKVANCSFNSVAVIFLLQVDNLAYEYGLSELIRSHVEQYARAIIEEHDSRALKWAKTAQLTLTVAAILLPVLVVQHWHSARIFGIGAVAGLGVSANLFVFVISFVNAWIAGGLEAMAGRGNPARQPWLYAEKLASMLAGAAIWGAAWGLH